MLNATITVDVDSGSLVYTSSDVTIVGVTGSGSGTRLRLFPTPEDSEFTLTFAKGPSIDSLNYLVTPAAAFGGSPLQANSDGTIVLTCSVLELYQTWSFAVLLDYTAAGIELLHDPTIVFNPPSTDTVAQLVGAPVAAEPIRV